MLLQKKFPYVVILKNTTDRPFSLLAILLNLGSAGLFIRQFAFADRVDYIRLIGVAVLLGMIAWNLIKGKKGEKTYFDRAYLVTGLLWMGMPYMQWLFLPFMLLALMEHQVKFPLEIGFSESQIVFNTLFRKKYKWNELSNVMLKDGLLTMDFLNNRILQREVEDDAEEDDASEEEFNQFCRQQLEKNLESSYGNIS